MHKIFYCFLSFVFLLTSTFNVAWSGEGFSLSSSVMSSSLMPAHLKGMIFHADQPFRIDFLMQPQENLSLNQDKTDAYDRLIRYFLAALAIPDQDQWVNLSPYEKESMIPETFGRTQMGQDLLEQDLVLKHKVASFLHPDSSTGRIFWQKVHAQTLSQFGTTEVDVDSINKVWIVPHRAVVYQKGAVVYVGENYLKVMLEEDYLATQKIQRNKNESSQIAREILREIVLPMLEKEVNEGKDFFVLRQIYSGMLLATWYKRTLKEAFLARQYANQAKVSGIDENPDVNQKTYDAYLKTVQQGAFNMIRDEVDVVSGQVVPRKYFSGGAQGYQNVEIQTKQVKDDPAENLSDLSTVDVVPTHFDIVSSASLNGQQQREMFLDIVAKIKAKYRLSKKEREMFDTQARLFEKTFVDVRDLPKVEAQGRIISRIFTDIIPDRLKDIRLINIHDEFVEKVERAVFERMRDVFSGIVDDEVIKSSRRYWTWRMFGGEERHLLVLSRLVYRVNVLFQEPDLDFEKSIVLRKKWKGNVVVVKAPADLTAKSVRKMNGSFPQDHPFREQMRLAILSGKVIELDLRPLMDNEAKFEIARLLFQAIGGVFQQTLSSEYHAEIDAKFVIEELLSNALVHGNALKLHIPIFFSFQTLPNRADVYLIEVYDVMSETKLSSQEKETVKMSGLAGQKKGLRIMSLDWEVSRSSVEGGSLTKAFPLSTVIGLEPSSQSIVAQNLGGIDMSPRTLDFEIVKQGGAFPVVVSEEMFTIKSFDGLSPRILGIINREQLPIVEAVK